MTVERRRDTDFDRVLALQSLHKLRQIALQVNAEREEVRQHEDVPRARGDELRDGVAEPRIGFEERGFVPRPASGAGRIGRYDSDGFVSRWHAGAVSKYDDSAVQVCVCLLYKMIRGSSRVGVFAACAIWSK